MTYLDVVRQSWNEGIEPDLSRLLKDLSQTVASPERTEELVVETVCEDMRLRWEDDSRSKKKTADYLRELPAELRPISTANALRIYVREWEVRTAHGDAIALTEIADQIPEERTALVRSITATKTYLELPPDQQSAIRDTSENVDDQYRTLEQGGAASSPSNFDTHATRSFMLSTQNPGPAGSGNSLATRQDPSGLPSHLGRYQVIRKLGSGAFGDVFLGYDEKLQRHVAIKVPRRQFMEQAGGVEGFLKEARAAAGLDHPGIVTTHDVIEDDAANVLIVMEYIDGGTLQDLIDQYQTNNQGTVLQAMGLSFVASVGYQVALALAEAHHHGLIHRDLKPANLMLKDEKLRVTDFGLAISVDETGKSRELAGTPAYMSPEQIDPDSSGLDARSDVWSLGVILYQLTTGRLPFPGRFQEVFEKIKNEDPVKPRALDRKIPEPLERVILRCLEKDPANRFPSVLDIADELRPLTIPKSPGFRWECVVLPLGIALTIFGSASGLGYISYSMFYAQFYDTTEVYLFGLQSFTVVALTLGFGPPLITLGNWFCCRRCKSLGTNASSIPCKVSRWAVACLAAGSASGGFGLPAYVLAIVMGLTALQSIRQRKRWLTGQRHVIAGLALGFILLCPWMFYWWCFGRIYQTAELRERFDNALEMGNVEAAQAELEKLEENALEFPVSLNAGEYVADLYAARLALYNGNYDKAIRLAEENKAKGMISINVRLCSQIIRATAHLQAQREQQLEMEKQNISESFLFPSTPLPAWAVRLLDNLGPIDPPPESAASQRFVPPEQTYLGEPSNQ